MITLATYKRPHNLLRFIAAYGITEASEPVLVLVDEDDDSYDRIVMPPTFRMERIPPGCTASKRANIQFERYPNEPYYAIMGDDVVPMTKHWDRKLKAAAGEWKIAYCADGIQNERLATHPFIGGELVRAQGFVEEPMMRDWYADNCRMDVGNALGLLVYLDDVEYDHQHHTTGKSLLDTTYLKQKNHEEDAYLYEVWRLNGGLRDTVERVRKAMLDKGVVGVP